MVTASSLTEIAVDSCLHMTLSCKKLRVFVQVDGLSGTIPNYSLLGGGWRPSSEQSTSYHSNSIFYFYFLPSWLVKLFIHKKKKNKHETWSRFCLYRNLNLIKLMMLNLQIKRGK